MSELRGAETGEEHEQTLQNLREVRAAETSEQHQARVWQVRLNMS